MHTSRAMRPTRKNAIFAGKWARRGVTTLGVAATLTIVTATPGSAFPPVGGAALGFGSTVFDDTAAHRLTTCQNVFHGQVTVNRGQGQGGEIRVDDISFSPCDSDAGISVRAGGLPWTLRLDARAQLTVSGVDLRLVTRNGTCRYTGSLDGARSFDGVYTISGALTRRSTGCGGPGRLGFSVLAESISVDGALLTP